MAKKKRATIYKTVIEVTVLSSTPLEHMELNEVAYAITEGDCSGSVDWKSTNGILIGNQAANAVRMQGSDPEFFQMDDDGYEL